MPYCPEFPRVVFPQLIHLLNLHSYLLKNRVCKSYLGSNFSKHSFPPYSWPPPRIPRLPASYHTPPPHCYTTLSTTLHSQGAWGHSQRSQTTQTHQHWMFSIFHTLRKGPAQSRRAIWYFSLSTHLPLSLRIRAFPFYFLKHEGSLPSYPELFLP